MADTVFHHLSTAEKYLLSAPRFWSLVSTVSVAGAVSSFYSTQQNTNSFNDSGKYIVSSIIAVHLIIFFSDPNSLKNKFAPFFPGSAMKWALRITAIRVGIMLHYLSETYETGLIFVICVWIDAIAIGLIIRPSTDLWILHSVYMAVVNRSSDLYGFSGRYWLVTLFCLPLHIMQVRLDGHKSDETDVCVT